MEGRSLNCLMFVLLGLTIVNTGEVSGQGTRVGFYSRTCPRAESIVKSTVRDHLKSDPSLAAGLLRLHFHDCFVQGCDASVLIEGPQTERTALPNLSLKGFEVINDAKTQLEAVCPGVVSCADILALATRDAVDLSDGPSWKVPTGRRDGRISQASEANNLPSPFDSVAILTQKFAAKGLNTQDLVVTSGGHTIGTTACLFFRHRLYNFTGNGGPDPSIDPTFLPTLRAQCPQSTGAQNRVALDTGSEFEFDRSYFKNLKNGRGILESDQLLWTDASTKTFVEEYSDSALRFKSDFAKSMVKMGNIELKTGSDSEIRTICSAIN
ncbi:cationic peroxidase 2-like [Vigna umbellata]|uniref:cationic peroxidase 2-like n=1 Tax=Vigna umbellata TaxID=87088 RepID=UPI001F5F6757|nr:cationic peroxidase 2-like [Vigna umbellata]